MTVGVLRLTLFIPENHSLKGKRSVLRRIKARVSERFNVSIAECDDHDLWQRAVLGVSQVGTDEAFRDEEIGQPHGPYCTEKNGLAGERRIRIHHASEIVTMDDLPAVALKKKKDSSMRVAINLVKEGVVQACVSAGNTGALMATGKFVLKTVRGISRPAICINTKTIPR